MERPNLSLSFDVKSSEEQEIIDYTTKNIKYPFNGTSLNLIDSFLIYGYEKKIIEYTYLYNKLPEQANKNLDFLNSYNLEERPCIINEIYNSFFNNSLEHDLITEIIFPNNPKMYYLDVKDFDKKQEVNKFLLSKSYSIIFKLKPEEKSDTKRAYNGLGYVFYSQQDYKENELVIGHFYVPMTYVIISEYPYFYHFNKICKSVLNQMKKENEEIPIEIILYNSVKFLQSPINKNIILLFEGIPYNNKSINMNLIYNPNYSKDTGKNENKISSIFFSQLSGYPIIDFNLSFIFNILPAEIIIQVFVFTFLEYDIIFCSNQPKILNLIMYIFYILNYPFNDSNYFRDILSIPKNNFISENPFDKDKKNSSMMIGILNSYDPEISNIENIKEHFVLNLDSKDFSFFYKEKTDEIIKTIDLQLYIKSCLEHNDYMDHNTSHCFTDRINLYGSLKNLEEQITRRANKVISINYNKMKEKPDFFTLYENESEIECLQNNNMIQKAFLTFIIQIIKNFVTILGNENNEEDNKNLNLIPNNDNNQKEEILNVEDLIKLENKKKLAFSAGNYFKEKFKKTSKYNSFVINFCQYQETDEQNRIPYTFLYEFIRGTNINIEQIDTFNLIDQFYGKKEKIDLEKIFCHHNDGDEIEYNSNVLNNNNNFYLFFQFYQYFCHIIDHNQ